MRLLLAIILVVVCHLSTFAQNNDIVLLPIKVNGLWGYMDERGRVVIEPQFQRAESFRGNMYAKVKHNGVPGLINKQGQVTQLPVNAKVEVFSGDFLLIEQDGKQGISDIMFNTILPVKYKTIKHFVQVSLRNTWRRFNPANDFILTTYDDSLWGLYNFSGDKILDEAYTYIDLVNNYFFVAINEERGLYNKLGSEILPPIYQAVSGFSNSLFLVQKDNLLGLYDTLGKQQFAHNWRQITNINQAWALFEKEDTSEVINLSTHLPIPKTAYQTAERYGNEALLITKNGKRGLYGALGSELLPAIFDDFYEQNNYYYTINNKLIGLCDSTGSQIVEPKYDYIDDVENNVAIVKKNNKWGLINTLGREIAATQYDDIDLGDNTAKCKKGNTLEIYTLNDRGQVTEVIKYQNVITLDVKGGPQWQNAGRNTQNLGTAPRRNLRMGNWFYDTAVNKWGLQNANGDTLIKPLFNSVTRTDTSQYAIVQLGDKDYSVGIAGFKVLFQGRKGLVRESDGKILVKPSMAYIDPIVLNSKGFVYARGMLLSGQYIIITPRGGRMLSGCRYIDEQHEGISRAFIGGIDNTPFNVSDINRISAWSYINQLRGRIDFDNGSSNPGQRDIDFKKGYWIYIDKNGRKIDGKYTFANNFYNRRAIVKQENYYGVINDNFQQVVKAQHHLITRLPHSDGKQFLVEDYIAKEGYIDTLGDPITGFNFDRVNSFSCGYGLVTIRNNNNGNLYYYVNGNGEKINNQQYNRANNFKDGFALVRNSKGYTHIDITGQEVTNEYRRAGEFSNGRAWIRKKGKYVIIDAEGTEYLNNTFTKLTPFMQNRATAVISGAKWVVIDKNADIVGKNKYKRTKNFDSLGNCIVAKKRKWGLIDNNNNVIIPFKYQKIEGPVAGKYLLRKSRNRYSVYVFDTIENKPKKLGKVRNVSILTDGRIIAQKGSSTYIIDGDDKKLLVNRPINSKNLYQEFCIIGSGSKMGVINYNGDTIMPTSYRNLRYLGYGLFYHQPQQSESKGEIITLSGVLVEKNIATALPFSNGFSMVLKKGKWGVIDADGIWVAEPKYDWVKPYENNFARAGTYKTRYIVNANGVFLTDANFEKLEFEPLAQLYRVELGKKVGYLQPIGDWVWTPKQ